ncbi:MAG: hypothetical protein CMJ18_18710 [Phycisphaeraceae bacterium]|nr:hypothetical protein [Phycisphaeraceae bacterium]
MSRSEMDWIVALRETADSYRRMIDAATRQLTDDELVRRPAEGMNSVAVILRHLGGNLKSRWTDFLTTDGEKPDRDRDTEFEDWAGDRDALMAQFDAGWARLLAGLDEIECADPATTIRIRGEPHTLPQAAARSIAHVAYHVGQIVMVGRMVHEGEWQWLTIAPGASDDHNRRTWGSSASRGTFGPNRPA